MLIISYDRADELRDQDQLQYAVPLYNNVRII